MERMVNNYEILEFVGKGSFGSVYKCRKNGLIYAMKVFSAEYIDNEFSKGENNRIQREIDALKKVESLYVLKYIDDGTYLENGFKYYYVITDFIDGDNLKSFLDKNTISTSDGIELFKKILIGVNDIHKCRIVHRDLKPENISIDNNGNIKILDFGLSKLIDFTTITSTGQYLGTPIFMSPEQIYDSKNIDYRSDYYSLGVLLFNVLTKKYPYGEITSLPELFHKIQSEQPISIRFFIPSIPNNIDNLITNLLSKKNFERANSYSEILSFLGDESQMQNEEKIKENKILPSFYVRLWNEKKVLTEFYNDGYSVENVIFPINHQNRQKGLLELIGDKGINVIIDPATMRLAYDTFSETQGLVDLPYAPSNLTKLEVDDFITQNRKQEYVKQVVDEQLKHGVSNVVSPFHVSNNSNLVKIKMDGNENWFSLDIKLFNETRDYLKTLGSDVDIICGCCVKTDILTTNSEKDYFLNVLSRIETDKFWVYVDCIDYNSNLSQLYNYADSLLELQKSSNKPVIAGRIGSFGLILLAFGLYAFESGTSRFESFYEELYKTSNESYNMYVSYYIPELMKNVAIERKNPAKIISMLGNKFGDGLVCDCPYCSGKAPASLADENLSRKHFLYKRNEEIDTLREFSTINERVEF